MQDTNALKDPSRGVFLSQSIARFNFPVSRGKCIFIHRHEPCSYMWEVNSISAGYACAFLVLLHDITLNASLGFFFC